MIEVKNVSLSFGTNEILRNLNFKVKKGEKLGIIGASGAGKSSIYKMLIGELKPTLGSIAINNIHLETLSFKGLQHYRRQIGVVFQEFHLLPQKTVYENIAFALEVSDKEDQIPTLVPALIDLVGLGKRTENFPHQLSGGEKQRVSIARALVHEPKILIADEATGNLDPKNSREIATLLQKINEEKNVTIIFSTHDPVLVGQLNPRIVRLEDRKIKFDTDNCSVEEAFQGIV